MKPPLATTATASATLTNAIGLHARPSVKLTKLAKAFAASLEIALDPAGPWVDAKSPVRIMRFKAPQGATLYFRAAGVDSEQAVAALVALVQSEFGDVAPDAAHG